MTAMQTLTQLVELKRAATDIDALDRYVAELYTATWAWTDHNPRNGIAALAYDALIDRIAHETPPEGTGADLRAEQGSDVRLVENADPEPADGRTG